MSEMMQTPLPRATSSDIRHETNSRIYERNIPSAPLQPYLDVRPLNSKYTRLPIVEPRQLDFSVPLNHYPVYSPKRVFFPASREAPYSGYAAAINVESDLKGQIFALQKCPQASYVPRSNSDLYQNSFISQTNFASGADTHELLFKREKFADFNANPYAGIVGVQLWQNATRAQMYDVPENYGCGNGLHAASTVKR